MSESLIVKLLVYLAERVGQLSQEVETLTAAVATLEHDDEELKSQVGASVVELKGLEEKVKQLEEAGAITPEQAKELSDKINTVATGITASTEALKAA